MASSKRTGFFWGEEKITLVEFEKNAPLHVISSSLAPKTDISSPFTSNLAEEIHITAIFKKMLQDNGIRGGPFYVSMPIKEIMLRSFVVPLVKWGDIQNVIKFEVRKYLPIDIQGLTFVFYTVPFTENAVKRLQVIFFAVRKESLERYERIFKQVNVAVSYAEPCMVSLTKVLLFKKEISPLDHLAFLILDKNSGCICFINQGIPQFVREFPIGSNFPSQETKDPPETSNLKIVNEVGNSIDFYERQFTGKRIEQMLVSAQAGGQDLFNALEMELKLKLRKASPVVTMGEGGQSNDIDAIYAMGACVEPPMEPLSGFNFLDTAPKSAFKGILTEFLVAHKEIIFVFLVCVISLVGLSIFFQAQLKVVQQQYDRLFSKQGISFNMPGGMPLNMSGGTPDELKDSMDKLAAYKNIRTKSEVALILLKVASHLPQGALLQALSVSYGDQGGPNMHVTIDMRGDVLGEDPNEQIAVVNRIFSDFKNDKELSRFIKNVKLVYLNRENLNGRQVMGFNIRCF